MKIHQVADRWSCRLLFVLVLISAFPILGWAQGSLGGLTGHVTDPGGATVPDVAVTVRNMDAGGERTTVTNQEGTYLVGSLAPGRYRVSVTEED